MEGHKACRYILWPECGVSECGPSWYVITWLCRIEKTDSFEFRKRDRIRKSVVLKDNVVMSGTITEQE
jgi:hypothetical protein